VLGQGDKKQPSRLHIIQTLRCLALIMRSRRISAFSPETFQPTWLNQPVEVWLATSGVGIAASLLGAVLVCLLVHYAASVSIGNLWGMGLVVFLYLASAMIGNEVRNYHKLTWSWSQFRRDLLRLFSMQRSSTNQGEFSFGLLFRIVDLGYLEEELGKQPNLRGKWLRNSLYVIQRAVVMLCVLSVLVGTVIEAMYVAEAVGLPIQRLAVLVTTSYRPQPLKWQGWLWGLCSRSIHVFVCDSIRSGMACTKKRPK
jgi:hypothetical protein